MYIGVCKIGKKMSYSCQYLQTAEYCDSCKQGAIPVLDRWYRAKGWRGTGIVQSQSWDQVSANKRLWSNASTEPVQISVLERYRWHGPVPRHYRWITSSQVTFRSCAGGRPCLCQYWTSTVFGAGMVPLAWSCISLVLMDNFQPSYLSEPRRW